MNWQRFPGPRAEDEIYMCSGCGRKFRYTQLNHFNLCRDCRRVKVPAEPEPPAPDA